VLWPVIAGVEEHPANMRSAYRTFDVRVRFNPDASRPIVTLCGFEVCIQLVPLPVAEIVATDRNPASLKLSRALQQLITVSSCAEAAAIVMSSTVRVNRFIASNEN
jgi:hypothetical protein